MKQKLLALVGSTQQLRSDIDSFYDLVGDATSVFRSILRSYLNPEPNNADIEDRLKQLNSIEVKADSLRREIETYLYEKTLVPDLRGDLLKLIEEIDVLINIQQASAFNLINEQPHIPADYWDAFLELQQVAAESAEHLIKACRAFLRDQSQVRDHVHKVLFCESEADKISTKLKRKIFSSELELAQKIHMRYYIERIDLVANHAEDIADSLIIYAIKRSM